MFCSMAFSVSLVSCDEDSDYKSETEDIYTSQFGQFFVPQTDSCSYWETEDYGVDTDAYACYQFYNNVVPEKTGLMKKIHTKVTADGTRGYVMDNDTYIWSKDAQWLCWNPHYGITSRYIISKYYTDSNTGKSYLKLRYVENGDTLAYNLVRGQSYLSLPQIGQNAINFAEKSE